MKISPKFFDDPGVQAVLAVFAKHAPDKVRIVGGCVRDAIMGRDIADVDFATPLVPSEVQEIFLAAGFGVEPTGIEHGTLTVIWNHEPFEITTLRRDVETDGRRAVVAFAETWDDDAQRRDFRFNALYLAPDGTVYDPTGGGIDDAINRQLVFVGDAETRIREDALRILRMYRFAATLGADMSDDARYACSKYRHMIGDLSGERLEKEALKLVGASDPIPSLRAMAEDHIFEEVFYFVPDMDVIERRFAQRAKHSIEIDQPINLLWMWDAGIADKVCQRWKTSKTLRQDTHGLMVDGPIVMADATRLSIWENAHRTSPASVSMRARLSWIDDPSIAHNNMRVLSDMAFTKPDFPVRGKDLIDAGMKPGRQIGQILADIENWWISQEFPDRHACMDRVNQLVTGE